MAAKDDGETAGVAILMATLKEAQDNVRTYDTKAQIVGVGYILASNIILQLGSRFPGTSGGGGLAIVLIAWVIFIAPIILFGAVLYPTRKIALRPEQRGAGAKGVFYLRPEYEGDVQSYVAEVRDSDVQTEIAYEIFKLSTLRDLKCKRFLRAMCAAGASLFVLFLGQLLHSKGLLGL